MKHTSIVLLSAIAVVALCAIAYAQAMGPNSTMTFQEPAESSLGGFTALVCTTGAGCTAALCTNATTGINLGMLNYQLPTPPALATVSGKLSLLGSMTNGTKWLAVRAFNAAGISGCSNEVTFAFVGTAPANPSNLGVSP